MSGINLSEWETKYRILMEYLRLINEIFMARNNVFYNS